MKFEKEITVEVSCNIEELLKILKENDFELKEVYDVNDIYMIDKKYKNIEDKLELLKHAILIRDIIEENKETKQITYKYKEYEDDGNIVEQGKCNCRIENASSGVEIVKCLGYDRELIRIDDHIVVYEKDGLELAIEYVNDKYLFVEVEANQKYDTIDKMKNALEEVGIEYDKSNYFQKKALMIFKDKY